MRKVNRRRLLGLLLFSAIAWLFGWGAAAWIPLPARLGAAPSVVIEYEGGELGHVFLTADDKYRIAVDLEEKPVDPAYLAALIALEDRRFAWHPGVDPLASFRALAQNLWRRRIVSGSSTLSMQLARLLIGESRPRTLAAKLKEVLVALQLERRLSKKQILRAYLQFLPFGRNLEGIETASRAYFGHSARALSASEIATLLAVPQDPCHRYPNERNRTRLTAARDRIISRLAGRGALSGAGTEGAGRAALGVAAEPVPQALIPLPREMPHAANWIRAQAGGKLRLRTTLNAGMQRRCEQVLAAGRRDRQRNGVDNGAIVLVDHRAQEVRALVGNVDFWDSGHGGQIAGFARRRSTGSLLKPFIFALALEKGQALPGMLVRDIPVRYGLYAPHNFDGGHAGLVRLDDALLRSLNIPFVTLLGRIGVEHFIAALRQAGATSLRDDDGYYGLSAAVGGIELTPLEAAGLFAMLAEDGVYKPLCWLADGCNAQGGGVRVLSAAAARLTQEVLERRDRPDFPQRRQLTAAPAAIHWKTGTSGRRRDAWSAGSSAAYTAVVWLGNFDNRSSAALVGADAAGPLLFDLLETFTPPQQERGLPQALRDELGPIEVCAYSGYPPAEACPLRRTVQGPLRSVPTATCPYHVALDIDLKTGLALSPLCRPGHRFERRVFLSLGPGIERWAKVSSPIPPYAPGCEVEAPPAPLEIFSPREGASLILFGTGKKQLVPLSVDSSRSSGRISWFVDGEYLVSRPATESALWHPLAGTHEIVALSESGQLATRTLRVTPPAR